MARLPRFFVPDVPLHIIQRGNNRDAIFGRPADFVFLYERLVLAARVHGVSVHAYVLMTNHLHLLVTPSLPTSVPKMMQSLGRIYVAYFNWRYGRTGTLWEGRSSNTNAIFSRACAISRATRCVRGSWRARANIAGRAFARTRAAASTG